MCRALLRAGLVVLAAADPGPFTPVLQELAGNLAAEAADLRRRVDAERPYCAFSDLAAALERDSADADVLEAAEEKASSEARAAESRLREIAAERAAKQQALAGAGAERTGEHADFIAREEAYARAIDLLQRGLAVTQQAIAQNQQVGGETLLAIKNAVAPLLQASPATAAAAAPALAQTSLRGPLPPSSGVQELLWAAQAAPPGVPGSLFPQPDALAQPDAPTASDGLEMLAPSFLQISNYGGANENQAILQVLSNLLSTFEAHRESLARDEAGQQQQTAAIQNALAALLQQAAAASEAQEAARAEASGRAADARARLAHTRALLAAEKGVATALKKACGFEEQHRQLRLEVLKRLLSKLPDPPHREAPSAPREPAAEPTVLPPSFLQVGRPLSFVQVAPPAAPQVQGMLSELLAKLTAVGAKPKGAAWCSSELPRAEAGLTGAQHRQGVLQDTAARLTTAAAAAEKAAQELEGRDGILAALASAAGKDVKSEAAVLSAEIQQHDVALTALRKGLEVMDGADANLLRELSAALEDLQEEAQHATAELQVGAEQLASAVTAARAAAAEAARGKRREKRDASVLALAAQNDAQSNAEQISLATKYVATLRPACAQPAAANTARAQEVEAVRQAARIVDAAAA